MSDSGRRSTRRELLKLSPAMLRGAFAVRSWSDRLLEAGVALSDRASGALLRRGHLAQTFADTDVVPFDRFPYNFYDVVDPEVDLDGWRLKVSGAVSRPGEYTLEQIRALPRMRSEYPPHLCRRLGRHRPLRRRAGRRFPGDHIRADPSASFVLVTCADGYYESLDRAPTRHPQSLLCYEMYDRPLDRCGDPVSSFK
jgi:DMSO/TMAO reductase YedYZ molybdopterin-dependent catalytic subunit